MLSKTTTERAAAALLAGITGEPGTRERDVLTEIERVVAKRIDAIRATWHEGVSVKDSQAVANEWDRLWAVIALIGDAKEIRFRARFPTAAT